MQLPLEELEAPCNPSHLLLFHTFPHRSPGRLKSGSKNDSALTTGADNGMAGPRESALPDGVELNNFGPHLDLQVVKDRQRNVTEDELK